MTETARKTSVPLAAVIAAGAMMGFTVLAVSIGRMQDIGLTQLPKAEMVSTVAFRVADQSDGSVAVRDAVDDRLLLTIQHGEDNFMRLTMRGLAQARQRSGIGQELPFKLIRYGDGSLSLDDDATGRKISLDAFGHSNALAFARLLPGESGTAQ